MAGLLILQTAVDEGLGGFYFGIVPEQVRPFRDAPPPLRRDALRPLVAFRHIYPTYS